MFGRGSPAAVNGTGKEEILNSPGSNLLHSPQSGHHRRSSAPEPLEIKTKPQIVSAAKNYRLKDGRLTIVRMPPEDLHVHTSKHSQNTACVRSFHHPLEIQRVAVAAGFCILVICVNICRPSLSPAEGELHIDRGKLPTVIVTQQLDIR